MRTSLVEIFNLAFTCTRSISSRLTSPAADLTVKSTTRSDPQAKGAIFGVSAIEMIYSATEKNLVLITEVLWRSQLHTMKSSCSFWLGDSYV